MRAKTRVELLHVRREIAVALGEFKTEIAESLSTAPSEIRRKIMSDFGRKLHRLLFVAGFLLLAACTPKDAVDEATASGRTVADFPETKVDLFQPMDRGIALTPEEIAGRNTWMLWTGGNEAFWDYLARNGYGLVEFLKVIDSRVRPERFKKFGLVNEPGFKQAPQPDEFGLYIDQPVSAQPDVSNPVVDGKSTGIIGFRLFPNPNFDEAARKRWDANRFYNDPAYYQDPKLVRPYRVGMTCALCHVAFHPLNPPQDPETPRWENLSSTLGNQYLRTRGIFGGDLKPDNFMYHILESARPGTVETSIIATDNNNNPNIINSIYNLGARLGIAAEERMAGPAIDFPPGGEMRRVPHVLVDGADSIGVPGALDRVFVNIGAFGEEWLRCHNPIIGLRSQKTFSIPNARKHSVYWRATEERTPNLARFLLRVSEPMPLREAPGGEQYLTKDQQLLDRGRIVFAENCMACHSSKQPNESIVRFRWSGGVFAMGTRGSDENGFPREQLSSPTTHVIRSRSCKRMLRVRSRITRSRQDLGAILFGELQADAVDRRDPGLRSIPES